MDIKKVYKNKVSVVLAVFILSVMLLSLMTAFLYRSDVKDLLDQSDTNKVVIDSEVALVDTVVISDPKDPYYLLAQEITESENATLIDSVEQLSDIYPKYLIYIASPGFLSEMIPPLYSRILHWKPF